MSMGFAPTWLRQVSPLLHKTTLTTGYWALVSHVLDTTLVHERVRHTDGRTDTHRPTAKTTLTHSVAR